jgi:vesicle coat complex subunit
MIRRIVIHHTYLIDEQHLKKFMDPINAACDNLRSAMSKNALLALAECFEFLGNPRIAQVMSNDKVLDALLRRSACEKRFLREAALFALEKLSKYSPSAIVIECAATHASSKNPKLCANAVKVIYNCLQELKTKKFHPTEFQDVRVLLKSLTIFLTGKDSGARKEAKASLDALAEMGGIRWFQNLVEKTLDERTGMKVLNECCRAGEGTSQDGKATVQGKSLRERIRQNFDCSST